MCLHSGALFLHKDTCVSVSKKSYLPAWCRNTPSVRRLTAVALRNTPAGVVLCTIFLTVAENLPLYRQSQVPGFKPGTSLFWSRSRVSARRFFLHFVLQSIKIRVQVNMAKIDGCNGVPRARADTCHFARQVFRTIGTPFLLSISKGDVS